MATIVYVELNRHELSTERFGFRKGWAHYICDRCGVIAKADYHVVRYSYGFDGYCPACSRTVIDKVLKSLAERLTK